MNPSSGIAAQARDDLRAVRQRRQALRTAIMLTTVAAAFFFGVILKHWLFGG